MAAAEGGKSLSNTSRLEGRWARWVGAEGASQIKVLLARSRTHLFPTPREDSQSLPPCACAAAPVSVLRHPRHDCWTSCRLVVGECTVLYGRYGACRCFAAPLVPLPAGWARGLASESPSYGAIHESQLGSHRRKCCTPMQAPRGHVPVRTPTLERGHRLEPVLKLQYPGWWVP